MHNARRWDQHVAPKHTSNVRGVMCQKSEELKEKNLQNSPVQRYIKLSRLDLFFSAINNRKLYGPLWGMCLFKFCHNRLTTVRLVIVLKFLCQFLYETEKNSNHRFLYIFTYFHTCFPLTLTNMRDLFFRATIHFKLFILFT